MTPLTRDVLVFAAISLIFMVTLQLFAVRVTRSFLARRMFLYPIGSVAELVDELARVLEDASDKAQRISGAATQQSAGIRQITDAMQSISQGGQDVAQGAKQIEDAAVNLTGLGSELHAFVGGAQA